MQNMRSLKAKARPVKSDFKLVLNLRNFAQIIGFNCYAAYTMPYPRAHCSKLTLTMHSFRHKYCLHLKYMYPLLHPGREKQYLHYHVEIKCLTSDFVKSMNKSGKQNESIRPSPS